jgi:hypothetical protein
MRPRFGDFEFNSETGELWQGITANCLRPQPARVHRGASPIVNFADGVCEIFGETPAAESADSVCGFGYWR